MREAISAELRRAVFERDGYTCQYCGCSGDDVCLEIDHIIPVSRGGVSDIRNLVTACEAFAIALASSLNSEADNLVNSTSDMFNAEEILAQVDAVLDGLQGVITKAQAEYFRLRTGEVEE